MERIQIRLTAVLIVLTLLVSLGLGACSETTVDEPAANPDEQPNVDTRSRVIGDREVLDNIYSFERDTVLMPYSVPPEATLNLPTDMIMCTFVPIKKIAADPDLNLREDDIKVIAAYAYDFEKFGTDLDPWINLNIEPKELPASVNWLTAGTMTKDDKFGIYFDLSLDYPVWKKSEDNGRALKLDFLIGLNDLQCTVCSMIVVEYQIGGGNVAAYFRDAFDEEFYDISPDCQNYVSASGGEGVITLSYNRESYEWYQSHDWNLPEEVRFGRLRFREKIGDPEREAEEKGLNITIVNNGWTIFDANRVMNSEGLCDFGWAKIQLASNPDGSKRFEYNISKNTTGKVRQIMIQDCIEFVGTERSLQWYRTAGFYWRVYIIQSK